MDFSLNPLKGQGLNENSNFYFITGLSFSTLVKIEGVSMPKVCIVTDSTANLDPSLINGLSIRSIPLQLILGHETLRDGIDIQPDEFYDRLKANKISTSTSQPSPNNFIEIFKELGQQGYHILALLISSKLSGTVASALQAKQEVREYPIEIVDSLSTSMAMGFQVIALARAAKEGATLQECKVLAEKNRQNTGALFVVSSLEYLHRGGRLGGAAAFMGTALNLKPILALENGRIEALEKVRTLKKATERLIELVEKRIIDAPRPLRLACLHANASQDAAEVLKEICTRFDVSDVSDAFLCPVSPVIGAHTGPGTIGLAYSFGL